MYLGKYKVWRNKNETHSKSANSENSTFSVLCYWNLVKIFTSWVNPFNKIGQRMLIFLSIASFWMRPVFSTDLKIIIQKFAFLVCRLVVIIEVWLFPMNYFLQNSMIQLIVQICLCWVLHGSHPMVAIWDFNKAL